MSTAPRTRSTAAQGMVEYALVLLLLAIASLLILQMTGVSVADVYCRVSSGFGASGCKGTAYCQDGFDANTNGWGVSQGTMTTWKVVNGQLCNSGTGVITNKCSLSNLPSNNYVVDVTNAQLTAGNGYGIFFRVTDLGLGINGYAFQYDPGLSGVVIRKWVNGVEINPALAFKSLPGYSWYSAPHKLSVSVNGNTFIGMVDGVPMLTVIDSTYPTGGTGLRTWDSTSVCMDGFNINPVVP